MTHEIKVALVSNRGPVSFVRSGNGFHTKRGAGGLAGALDPVARRLGDRATWIVAATSQDDRDAVAAGEVAALKELLGYPVHMLDIDVETYDRYYDRVSNRMLWFANHCLWDELDLEDLGADELEAWRHAYEPVNERFAQAAVTHADPDSLMLFQDYHLATAPRFLRDIRPDQTSLHFTHSSFCGVSGYAPLPDQVRRRVIEGMLGADLVGFHVTDWANAFLDCCECIGANIDRRSGSVVHQGRRSWVRAYPIPIDAQGLRDRSARDETIVWESRFSEHWTHGPPRQGHLIVRADRTEPSKNIVRGFEAFGLLLDRRSDLADSARFIACIYPSRQSMAEYRAYSERIEQAVQAVNDRHPGTIQLYVEDEFDRTLAALRIYDVLLVNPIMDGMNLVSKEGPALNQKAGALVLSRGAGSFAELGEHAIPIEDALNVEATARALERALDMDPAERARRAAALKAIAGSRRPEDWIDAQLEDLASIQQRAGPVSVPAS